MKVTLAYPWTDDEGAAHKPDSTVDVDDSTASNLIAKGWARPADNKKEG